MSLVTGEEFSTRRQLRSESNRNRPARNDQRKFLPEVQGLRAVAVLMVVTYHVWFGRISGGVDIFLLISSFLLTGQFTRKLESGRALELFKYWAHLFKRLLPMIALTLLATLIGVYLLLPETVWTSMFGQTWASLLYYQNWFLAAESVDYYATDHSAASPIQHFWSLSIQGQIFILWPLIFAVAGGISRVGKLRIRPLLIYMFGSVFTVSLVFSIITTQTNQAFAYFDTRTRLWEFALGSLLALILPYLAFKRPTRIVLGWVGIIAMLSCGIILQVGQQFPGYMALWPTLAATFVIVAGFTDSKFGADRFLSWKPLVKLGDSSYALYLFHWPLLVFFLVFTGRDHAGPRAGTAIILVSILLAIVATKLVDTPVRRSKWIEQKRRRALLAIAICVAVVAAPLGAWQYQVHAQAQALLAQADRNNPGAASLFQGFVDEADVGAPMIPALTDVGSDWAQFQIPCISDKVEVTSHCTNGVQGGTKNVVVLGSSHADTLNGPVLELAKQNHWQVTSIIKGYCPLGMDTSTGVSESCVDFNKATLAEVLAMKPDLVITTSTRTSSDHGVPEALDDSWVSEVRTLNDAGIKVVAVRDTPRFEMDIPGCMIKNPEDLATCAVEMSAVFAVPNPTDAIAGDLPNTKFLDFTSFFCPNGRCEAVIGNVIVYLDNNHPTATYMRSLTPIFAQEIKAATGWNMK